MSTNTLSCLNQIASYLKVPLGKLTIDADTQMPVRIHENVSVKGFINIINEFLRISNISINGSTIEDKAEIFQWIEYALVYVMQGSSQQNNLQLLNELNSILATKTYFVGNSLSIVDIVLYYVLQNIMESISYLAKEKYLHVSRWFDNIQQNNNIRQKNKIIDFSTNYLTNLVPARH